MRKLLKIALITSPIIIIIYALWFFSLPLRSKPLEQMPFENTIILGAGNAPVTITLFTDYRCPACREFHQKYMTELETRFIKTGKAKLRIQPYPLHPESATIELMMRNAQKQSSDIIRSELIDLAFSKEGFELSPAKFAELVAGKFGGKIDLKLLLASTKQTSELEKLLGLHHLAREHGVFSVPSIAVNEVLFDDPRNMNEIEKFMMTVGKEK